MQTDKNSEQIDVIVDRLYNSKTKSFVGCEDQQIEFQDTISRKPVPKELMLDIVERLYTSDTEASSGGKRGPKVTTNKVSRPPATADEMKEIYQRLSSAHTKSSRNQKCRTYEEPKPPGYGLKLLPVIDGLEKRFNPDSGLPKEKVEEVVQHLHTKQTGASQARRDNPRHLLYPERTLLMNNVERILDFQEKGSLVKQTVLQRREKWYN